MDGQEISILARGDLLDLNDNYTLKQVNAWDENRTQPLSNCVHGFSLFQSSNIVMPFPLDNL